MGLRSGDTASHEHEFTAGSKRLKYVNGWVTTGWAPPCYKRGRRKGRWRRLGGEKTAFGFLGYGVDADALAGPGPGVWDRWAGTLHVLRVRLMLCCRDRISLDVQSPRSEESSGCKEEMVSALAVPPVPPQRTTVAMSRTLGSPSLLHGHWENFQDLRIPGGGAPDAWKLCDGFCLPSYCGPPRRLLVVLWMVTELDLKLHQVLRWRLSQASMYCGLGASLRRPAFVGRTVRATSEGLLYWSLDITALHAADQTLTHRTKRNVLLFINSSIPIANEELVQVLSNSDSHKDSLSARLRSWPSPPFSQTACWHVRPFVVMSDISPSISGASYSPRRTYRRHFRSV
nr:hypothetical protein CFP56_21638 [Quercus suber]